MSASFLVPEEISVYVASFLVPEEISVNVCLVFSS